MGGRPSLLWVTFEQFEEETGRCPQVHARPGSFEYGLSSSTSETPINRSCSQNDPFIGGRVKSDPDPSPVFHDTEDFPAAGVVIEDSDGQPQLVLEAKAGAQILKVRDPHKSDAPIKERRWMVDVFPVGWKAKQEETELYLELEKDVRI